MKKYELEMQIQKQMEELQNQKAEDRKTVEQLCNEWNWTLSDKEATIVNNITINKGKVTAIEIAKEDTATIEMLRETIRNMNQTINDMNKEHDELYKLYLEEQREKEVWVAAHEELKDALEVKDAVIENLKAQLKAEKEKQPRIVYVEVADDPTYDNEHEPEEEVVNEVEEIIVPVTKEEKPVSNSPYSISIKTTHDAVKAKITVEDKVFYAAWSVAYNKPAYALVDNHKQYTRKDLRQIGLGIAYKYDKQIIADLKPLRDKLLEELEVKRNKNNNRKPEPQSTKDDVIETPEEIEVPIANDEQQTYDENDISALDDMEFF